MEKMMLQSLPVRRLSRAEYHYRWENYLCLGCDGNLTLMHKCPRKILVWIENEGEDDEEMAVEFEKSSKALEEVVVLEEHNLFDKMPNSKENECMVVKVENIAQTMEKQKEIGNLSSDNIVDDYNLQLKNEKQKTYMEKLQIEVVGYVNSGDLGATLKVFDEMLERDMCPDNAYFDILIDGLVKKSRGENQPSKPIPEQMQEDIVYILHMGQRSYVPYLLPKLSLDQTLKVRNFIHVPQFCARTLGPMFATETWKFMENNSRWSDTSYFLTNHVFYGWKFHNIPLSYHNATLVHAMDETMIDKDTFYLMTTALSTTMSLAKIILIFDPGGRVHPKFHLEDKVVRKGGNNDMTQHVKKAQVNAQAHKE